MTREIDNFFPDQFDYLNIRVYDDEATELLKHWDRTYKYIRHALESGSKVLVHCKMGVSRSASVVVAYAMKARHWDLPQALRHVKERRACVKPNTSFMHQLEIYAGILDASRQRHNQLWRSKSETNLATRPALHLGRRVKQEKESSKQQQAQQPLPGNSPTAAGSSAPNSPMKNSSNNASVITELLGGLADSVDGTTSQKSEPVDKTTPRMDSLEVLEGEMGRPKSWSPDDSLAETYFPSHPESPDVQDSAAANRTVCVSLRVPCSNGRTYSVSQNRAVKLESSPPPPPPPPPPDFSIAPDGWNGDCGVDFMDCLNNMQMVMFDVPGESSTDPEVAEVTEEYTSLPRVGSVKDRICELEASTAAYVIPVTPVPSNRTGLVLNLAWNLESQLGGSTASSTSPPSGGDPAFCSSDPVLPSIQLKPVRCSDLFSDRVDRVFDREERRQSDGSIQRDSPLRQRSWGASETRHRSVAVSERPPVAFPDPPKVPTFSSDPSLLSMPSDDHIHEAPTTECSRGLVRMQREALEKATGHQRRSLPDETVAGSSAVFGRSISETAATAEGSVSVMQLRKALEAKATAPLTGSFAPSTSVLVAVASAASSSSHSTQTSPTRQRPPPIGAERLRKRSLSLERMIYTGNSFNALFLSLLLFFSFCIAQSTQDWTSAAQAAIEEVDLNVKVLVGRFETPARPVKIDRPRGWSESSLARPPHVLPPPLTPRHWLSSKPPVPNSDSYVQLAQLPRPAVKERKLYHGKTHPLDRLTAGARQQQKLAQPVFGTM